MAINADYIYTGSRALPVPQNINLTFNPATGRNHAYQDATHRPFPDWGIVEPYYPDGVENYHAMQLAFNKRYSN